MPGGDEKRCGSCCLEAFFSGCGWSAGLVLEATTRPGVPPLFARAAPHRTDTHTLSLAHKYPRRATFGARSACRTTAAILAQVGVIRDRDRERRGKWGRQGFKLWSVRPSPSMGLVREGARESRRHSAVFFPLPLSLCVSLASPCRRHGRSRKTAVGGLQVSGKARQ